MAAALATGGILFGAAALACLYLLLLAQESAPVLRAQTVLVLILSTGTAAVLAGAIAAVLRAFVFRPLDVWIAEHRFVMVTDARWRT